MNEEETTAESAPGEIVAEESVVGPTKVDEVQELRQKLVLATNDFGKERQLLRASIQVGSMLD